MPTSRSYQDACGIARALDVVGERWALLIVRELLFGPLRFSDLRRALPGASSNLVADRLRELDGRGVVRRRRQAPPAASQVYELTEWGRELEPIVLALGEWGSRVPLPAGPTTVSAASMLIYLRGAARLDPRAAPATYRLEMADRVWAVHTRDGRVRIEPGEPADPVAGLRTDPGTFNALLARPSLVDSGAGVEVSGDRRALRRLLRSVSSPSRRSADRGPSPVSGSGGARPTSAAGREAGRSRPAPRPQWTPRTHG
jgi:DNA-binding HxlR family transcriptional regulator